MKSHQTPAVHRFRLLAPVSDAWLRPQPQTEGLFQSFQTPALSSIEGFNR